MTTERSIVRRGSQVLRADPRRVLAKLFMPGQEVLSTDSSRADTVMQRALALTEEEVARTLSGVRQRFAGRHRDLRTTFAEHFALVAHRLPAGAEPSPDRRDLIGAYFTNEYAVEAAALFNPSMVLHPDQSGLSTDEARFVMSVRAVGEGHISSIEFRTGVVGNDAEVRFDDPGRNLVAGRSRPATLTPQFLRDALTDLDPSADADYLLATLPPRFEAAELDRALAAVPSDHRTRGGDDAIAEQVRWIASCNYRLEFPADCPLGERLIYPSGPDERNGVEDARFTRFVEDDGRVTYLATYTAFDGARIAPHLLQTDDFLSFESSRLVGPAARNKGIAIFPRRVHGEYLALSRWNREDIGVTRSDDARTWRIAVTVQTPAQPWELLQLGNCGPPIETPAGWLVLTHGVGPMREYAIGATLLDLDQPTRMIASLREPLLTPADDERDGYVPNVVYSCGALLHNDTLVLPYGSSDSAVHLAFVDLEELLARLRDARLTTLA